MKLSGGVEWALHCCTVLAGTSDPVAVVRLAELHDVPTAYLAKHLQALSRAGILHAAQGKAGGYKLTRSATKITVLDVVEAIDGPQSTFVCTEIRQRGPLAAPADACTRPCAINRAMTAADQAWRAALRQVTIADLQHSVVEDYETDVLGAITNWLADPARS